MSRKSVVYKGVDVVYSHVGGGETLVLLHGFLEERGMWDGYAEALAKHYTVICVDLLGQGETGCLGYVHTMHDHTEAVGAVLNAEGVNDFKVVGHSMGGYVALELAHMYPERINALVLFHSTAYEDSQTRKLDRERVIELVKRNKSIYVKTVIPSLFADGNRDNLNENINELAEIAQSFTDQGIIANIRGMMERHPRLDVLRSSLFEKLLLHGELDSVIPTSDMEKLAVLNENIDLEIVNGIGHMGHLEAPEKCLGIILEFLAR